MNSGQLRGSAAVLRRMSISKSARLRWPTATFFKFGPPSGWRRFFFFDIVRGYKCSSAKMHALRPFGARRALVRCRTRRPCVALAPSVVEFLTGEERMRAFTETAPSTADDRSIRVRGALGYLRRILGSDTWLSIKRSATIGPARAFTT